MKVAIVYYSGAGNTECVAKLLGDAFRRRALEVFRHRLTLDYLGSAPEVDVDLLGIGFPIHFRKAPQLVHRYVDQLERVRNGVFLFCTKGLYSGNAAREVFVKLHNKGFALKGHMELYMPGSDALLLWAKKNSLSEKMLKSIYSRNIRKKIEQAVDTTLQNGSVKIPSRKWYTFIDNVTVRQFEKHFANDYQKFVGRFISLPAVCNHCRLCVDNCPTQNIRLVNGNGITFGRDCDFCLRCIHRCPTEAIQISCKTEQTVRYRPQVGDFTS